jgi:hypothetical protein
MLPCAWIELLHRQYLKWDPQRSGYGSIGGGAEYDDLTGIFGLKI